MTRRDFVLIAQVLAALKDRKAADAFAAMLATTNSGFDKRRFLIACGFTDV